MNQYAKRRSALNAALLPGLSRERIFKLYASAPGNEIASGKFFNPESSACLVANAFGPFFENAAKMPALPGIERYGVVFAVTPEVTVRFPWRGGRHPCLDLVIETGAALIGVESKRYEPFRTRHRSNLSKAYDRQVWGEQMARYQRLLMGLRHGTYIFRRLDAAQLIKHAFGLRTAADRKVASFKQPVLFYLFAEPKRWPDKRVITEQEIRHHREEIERFAAAVEGDEVVFHACSYRNLISAWALTAAAPIKEHVAAVLRRFDIARTA